MGYTKWQLPNVYSAFNACNRTRNTLSLRKNAHPDVSGLIGYIMLHTTITRCYIQTMWLNIIYKRINKPGLPAGMICTQIILRKNKVLHAHNKKLQDNPQNTLEASVDFPSSLSAYFLLKVSRAMKVGPWQLKVKTKIEKYPFFVLLWQLPSPCPQHWLEDDSLQVASSVSSAPHRLLPTDPSLDIRKENLVALSAEDFPTAVSNTDCKQNNKLQESNITLDPRPEACGF